MNVPFVIAQATTPSGTSSGVAPVQTIKLIKPESGHAEVFHLSASGPVKVDFSAIANEKITLVHVGDDLIVLFDNDTTTTLDNFFNVANQPAPNVYVELGDGRDVTSTMFAAEFPFTTDQSVLPAAGDQGQSGHPFPGPEVDPLASWNPLPLQPPEELPNWQISNVLLNDFINDHPTFDINNPDILLDEDFLDSPFPGNHDQPFRSPEDDDATATALFSGTMHYDFHSDGPAATNPLVIDTVSLDGLGLKSHGDPVVFNWDSTNFILTAYVDNDGTPGLSGGDKTVLTLKFGSDVLAPGNDHSFTVKMLAPFDDAPGGNENNEILPLNITITDSNGDPISGTVNINIDDDMPVMGQGDRDWTLDEDVLTNGNDALDNPADTNDYTLIANKNLGVNWGADGPGTLSFAQTDSTHPIITITDQNGNPVGGPLQSNGVDLVYHITDTGDGGQTLTATAGGNTIFTLTLDPDAGPNGTFTFNLLDHLDHPAGDGQNQLDLNFGFTATDFDVDPVDSNIVIRVTDDVPYVVGGDRDWTLDEDVLTNGNDALDNPADTNDYTLISDKNLGVVWGADGPGALSFAATDAQHPTITITDQNGNPVGPLTSNHVALTYDIVTNPDGGQTLTATAGANTIFTITLDPDAGPNGTFTFDLQGHLDHPTDDGQNRLDLNFGFTATDGDSDPVDSNIVIRITDDVPYVIGRGEDVSVNENDIATPWSLGTSPGDGHTDSGGAAFATGNLSGLVASGVDTPITWGFSSTAIAQMEALGLFSKQTAFPDNGQSLTYTVTQVGGDTVLSAFEPTTPGIPGSGNIVFTFTLDTSSGDFTFRLFDELIHVAGDGTNTDLRSGGPTDGPGGTQASIPYIDFGSIITATDSDGDSVTLTDKVHVTVVDDIPQVHIGVDPLGIVQHDETPGVQNSIFQLPPDLADSDTNSSAVKAVFAALEAGHQTGDDPDVSGSGAIGYAQSVLPVVFNADFLNLTVGADSPPEGSTFSLQVTNGTYSGVQTTEGVNIYLYSENGLIVGRLGGDSDATPDQPNPNGTIAFAIAIEPDGKIDLAQYLSLHHLNSGDSDDSISLADGTVSAVLSITDSDGDTVTDSADISGHIRFDDDGPDVGHNAIVQVDDDVLGGNPNGPGDDADAVNTVGTLSHDYGSDGAGSTLLLGTGAPSGFVYAVTDGGTVLHISQNGTEVLRVTLTDSTSGAYTVEQLHAIDHPSGHNENNDTFNVAYRVTDGDGDHVNGTLKINVDDDTPIATGTIVSDYADEDGLGTHDVDAGRPGEVAGTNSAIATGSLGALFSPGADVPLTYSLLQSNAAINTLISQHLHSGGTELSYSVSGDTLTGYVEVGGSGGYQPGTDTPVFTLQVTSSGDYTFTLLGELDHPTLDGLTGDNIENTLAIGFGGLIHAVDHDDDPVNASGPNAFQITVLDDIPSIVSGGTNFIVDGDFAGGAGDFPLHVNEWGANSGADTDGITGWTVTGSPTNPAGFVELERVGDGYLGMHTSTGGSMIDMAASPGNIAISQTVSGLAAGQTYAIQFEAGAPFPTTAELQVYWGGTLIGTIDPNGPMTSYNYIVTSNGTPQVLEFREVGDVTSPTPGAADGGYHGTYLANVAMVVASVVDEDGLTGPNSFGNHDSQIGDAVDLNADGDNNEATTTGSLNITWGVDDTDGGADGSAADTSFIQDGALGAALTGRNVTFSDNSVVVSGGIPLTSHGDAVTFVLSGNNTVLTGMAGGREVFTVSLSDDGSGSYRFILKDQLDHAPNGNENDISLSFHYTATDFDGDSVSSSFTVGVDDDMPIAKNATADAGTVFEDGLPGANAEPGHTDLSVTITSATLGSLVSVGADEPATFTLNSAISGNVKASDGSDVTSGGAQVKYAIVGGNIIGYADVNNDNSFGGGDREVFRIEDTGGGSFKFTLEGALDHLPLNAGGGDNETLTLNLATAFQASDFDGDHTNLGGVLGVTVENDVPVVVSDATNYATNGDFTQGNWTPPAFWGSSAAPGNVPGWNISGSPIDPPVVPPDNAITFERQADGFLGLFTSDGANMIDLGASGGNYELSQNVGAGAAPDLVAGQQYVVQFEAGAPFPETALLEVLWNGQVIGTIDTNVHTGQLDKYAFTVEGTGDPSTDKLTFREIGTGDLDLGNDSNGNDLQNERYHGTYIANVQISAVNAEVDEDGLNTPLSVGNGDSNQIGDAPTNSATVTAALNVLWGADSTDTADIGGVQDGAGSALTGRTLTFTDNLVDTFGTLALKSNGDAVSFQLQDNGTKLVGVAGGDDRVVFEVTLSDDGTGAFTFTLFDQLDHSAGADENDLALKFHFTATDFDGDSANGSFTVGIDDDVPVLVVEQSTQPHDSLNLALDETVQPDNGNNPNFDHFNGTETESGGGASNGGTDDVGGSLYNHTPVIDLNPNANQAIGSLTTAAGAIASQFHVAASFGADGPGPNGGLSQNLSLQLSSTITGTNLTATDTGDVHIAGLSAADRAISLYQVSDTVIEGRIAGADGVFDGQGSDEYVAFRITLNNASDPSTASITVDQFMAIDHDGSEDPSVFDENTILHVVGGTLGLTLDVTATDFDGDPVEKSVTLNLGNSDGSFISFDDDGPQVLAVTPTTGLNLIQNGSFEQGHIDIGVKDWNIYDSLPGGWTTGSDNIPFEVQTGGAGGLDAEDSNTLIELDGDTEGNPAHTPQGTPDANGATNATIQQVIAGTEAGQTYELSFWYAPRPVDGTNSSGMTVSFDGHDVYTIPASPNPPAGWQLITLQVTATGPNSVLAFTGTGSENEFGALLDNVSLHAVTILDDEDTTLNPAVEIQGGPGDDGHGVTATGKIDFDAGTDGLHSIQVHGMDGLQAIYVDANGIGHPESVSYNWVANGSGGTLFGTMNTPDGIKDVLSVVVDADGNYTFHLVAPLDHHGHDADGLNNGPETSFEDNLNLGFGFTITDGDGDTANGTIAISVDDDSPEAQAASVCVVLDEPSPSAGVEVVGPLTFDFTGINPPTQSVTQDGVTLSVNEGMSNGQAFGTQIHLTANAGESFSLTNFEIGLNGANATPHVIMTATDVNGITEILTIDVGFVGAIGSALPTTFDPTGTVFDPAGHPASGFDPLQITSLTIERGVGSSDRVIVDNFHVNETEPGLVTNPVEATADLSTLALFGADGEHLGGGFALKTFTTQAFGTLTADGEQVFVKSDGTTLTGYTADNAHVFTLTIDGHNAVFTLNTGLDQGQASQVGLDFGNFITATDGDGDQISLDANAVEFKVHDSTPPLIAGQDITGVVEEEQLGHIANPAFPASFVGNEDTGSADSNDHDTGTTPPGSDVTTNATTGTLTVTGGVGPYTFQFSSGVDGNQAHFTDGSAVTSGGNPVLYSIQGTTLIGYVNSDAATGYTAGSDHVVFTITLDSATSTDGTDGYTFTLYDHLDHDGAQNSQFGDNVEGTLSLDLAGFVTVSDNSGTNAPVSLNGTIDVIDDTPIAHDDTNSIGEGSLLQVDAEHGVLANDSYGADGPGAGTSLLASNGHEITIPNATFLDDLFPTVAALSNGGFVMAWTRSPGPSTVHLQIFDGNGNTVGSELNVGQGTFASVAPFGDGFVLTWQGGNIHGQLYNADGTTDGSAFTVNTTSGTPENAWTTTLADGGFVVSWLLPGGGSNEQVFLQRYDAHGVAQGGEVQVSTSSNVSNQQPAITGLEDGGFVAVWTHTAAVSFEVVMRRFDADGNPLTGEITVNTHIAGNQQLPTVAGLADGGFVVVWDSSGGQDGSGRGIFAQRYDADGTPHGGEFQVNSFTTGDQSNGEVMALVDGGFLVTWMSDGQDGSGLGIYGQRYDAAGAKVGAEFLVNETATGNQITINDAGGASMAQLVDGTIVTSWYGDPAPHLSSNGSPSDVHVRLFDISSSSVVGVRAEGVDSTTPAQGGVESAINGLYGTLTLHADGSYTYQSNPNQVLADGTVDSFVYTIKDGDGDISTATLKIALGDSTPHPLPAEKLVDEAGLEHGSATSLAATQATGDLNLGDTDTPHVTHIAGTGDNSDVGGSAVTVHGTYGTLQIDQNGNYTYTLTANDPNHTTQGTAADGQTDVFTYTVTDSHGNENTSTITIDIKDDVPTANDDTVNDHITGATTLTGLLGNDVFGADGVDTDNSPVAGKVTASNGGHGTVVYNNDGTFTYTPDADYNGTDSFTYTIKDGDGDTSTATVTLADVHTNNFPSAIDASLIADEDDLTLPTADFAGNQDQPSASPGDDNPSNLTGHIANFGGDGPGGVSFDVLNNQVVTDTSSATVKSGGEALHYFWDGATNTLYGSTDTTDATTAADTASFEVVIDQSTGDYTFTLLNHVDHPLGDNENNVNIDIPFIVSDSTPDTANGTIHVSIDDDMPVAHNDVAETSEGTKPTMNAILVLDFSQSMADTVPGTGGQTRLQLMKTAVVDFLSSTTVTFNQVTVYTFGINALLLNQFTDPAAAALAISGLNSLSAGTNYQSAITLIDGNSASGYAQLSHPAADSTNLYFLSDGDPTGGTHLTSGQQTAWTNFLNDSTNNPNYPVIDKVYAIGFSEINDTSFLQEIAVRNGDTPETVTDPTLLSATLSGTLPGSVDGNILADHGQGVDTFGADGGHIQTIKVGGITFTFDGDHTINATGTDANTHVVDNDGKSITVGTSLGGTLTFYFAAENGHAAGDWNYASPGAVSHDETETFHYTLVDGDGDTAEADLTITVKDIPNAPPQLALHGEEYVLDQFGSQNYGNNDGTVHWAGDWHESSDGSGNAATNGQIHISNNQLLFDENGNGASIERVVDLSGAATATLSYHVNEQGFDSGDTVTVQFAANGSNFVTVDTIDGSTNTADRSITLTGPFTDDATIRFVVGNTGNNDTVFIDDVKIDYTLSSPDTNFSSEYTEGGTPAAISHGSLVTDSDDTQMSAAKIVLTNEHSGDFLAIGGTHVNNGNTGTVDGINYAVVDNGSQVTVNLSGTHSLADYEAAINAITFASGSSDPSTADRLVDVSVTDAHGNVSNTAETVIAVHAVTPPEVNNDTVITNIPDQGGHDHIVIPDWALLANDTDANGNVISISDNIPSDSSGTASHSGNAVTFEENSNGDDNGGSFTYIGETLSTTPVLSDDGNVTINRSQNGQSSLDGTNGSEILLGRDNAADIINGNDGNDVLLGGNGSDTHGAVAFSLIADGSDSSSNDSYLQFHFSGGASTDFIQSITINLRGGADADAIFDGTSGSSHGGDGEWGPIVSDRIGLDSNDVNLPSGLDNTSSMTITFDSGSFGVGNSFNLNVDVDSLGSSSDGEDFAGSGVIATITMEDGRTETVTFTAVDSNTSQASFSLDAPTDDVLNGGAGSDVLWGGTGNDELSGGTGADHFLYRATNEGLDHILDFNDSEGDTIDILASAFGGGLTAGTDASGIFNSSGNANFTSSAERFHFDTTSHTLYYDADGSGGTASVALATFDNDATVQAHNVHLV